MPALRRDAMHAVRWDGLERSRTKGRGDQLSGKDVYALKQMVGADLFWVSAEMSELCHDATADLKEAHLGRDLWPTEAGFMVFAEPIALEGQAWLNANDPALEPIRAAAWYPEDGRCSVLLFTDLTAVVEATIARLGDRLDDEDEDARRRRNIDGMRASTGIKWLVPAGGDEYPVDGSIPLPTEPGSCPAGFMLSTVWLLMGQRGLATVTVGKSAIAVPKNKAARRRQEPERRELDAVRIIEIRSGTDHAAAYTDITSAYRHRWMVKGHWRQQWYASLQLNRPVWIAPYLKGPEGAPLLTGEKVHVWKGR